MRRNRRRVGWLLAAAASVVCAACAPVREPVFVDLTSIPAAPAAHAVEAIRQAPEAAVEVSTVAGPGASPEAVLRSLGAEREREARESIEHNRKLALRDLERALFRSYSRDLDRYRAEQEAKLAVSTATLYDGAYDAISVLFREYADSRGPQLARLGLLVGFPLPKDRWPEARPEVFWSAKRLAEAGTLRDAIASMDAEYRAKAEALLLEARKGAAEFRTRLEIEIAERSDALIRQSQEEAAKALSASSGKMTIQLATASAALPPSPAVQTASVAPMPPLSGEPVWTAASGAAGIEMETLRRDLRLWLDMNGYQRVESRQNGREATREFIEWRRTRRLGPLSR